MRLVKLFPSNIRALLLLFHHIKLRMFGQFYSFICESKCVFHEQNTEKEYKSYKNTAARVLTYSNYEVVAGYLF